MRTELVAVVVRRSFCAAIWSSLLALAACGAGDTVSLGEGGAGGCAVGASRPCYTGPEETAGVGVCADGVQVCEATGAWGDCEGQVVPGVEDCTTAEDDDCDGQANEESDGCVCAPGEQRTCYGGPPGTEGVGPCLGGEQLCEPSGQAWGACEGEVLPAVESCSLAGDEDCDGVGCADPLWGRVFGGAGDQRVQGVAVDAEGNTVAVGTFSGTIDFGATGHQSAGARDVFVVKLDPDGGLLWSFSFGDAGDDEVGGVAIHAESGDVLIGGWFEGEIQLGSRTLDAGVNVDGTDGYLARIAPDGTVAWARQLSCPDCFTRAVGGKRVRAVTFDAIGNVFATGDYQGHFGCNLSVLCTNVQAMGADVFVIRYSPNGVVLNSRVVFRGPGTDVGRAILARPSGLYIAGSFDGQLDMGAVLNSTNGLPDVFVARLNGANAVQWVDAYEGSGTEVPAAIAADADDNLYVVGHIGNTADFGGGPVGTPGADDVFLLKLGSDGGHVMSRAFDTPNGGEVRASGVAVDGEGHVLLGGWFESGVDLGDEPLASAGSFDAFLAKLDAQGNTVWSKAIASGGPDTATCIAVGADGAITVGGTVGADIDFGFGVTLHEAGEDAFVARYAP